MFSITSRERKVTNYVRQQAYEWLYARINEDQYMINGDSNLLLTIKAAKKIDEASYKEFVRHFNNNPYSYMLNHDNPNFKNIYTKHIDNYFINYNNVPLPAGFVLSFFEDDYETVKDKVDFYSAYLEETLSDMINGCKLKKNNISNAVSEVKSKNIAVLKPKFGYHLVNGLIKIFLPLFAFIICLAGFIGLIVDNGGFSGAEHAYEWIINSVGAALMFLPAIKAIKHIIFYIRWGLIKHDISSITKLLEAFNNDTLTNFEAHFTEINSNLVKHPYIEDAWLTDPDNKKEYQEVIGYEKNKLIEKLDRLRDSFAPSVAKKRPAKKSVNIMGGTNKWFFALIINTIFAVLGFMVNNESLYRYIEYVFELVL